jgi:hypothetical protein
VPTAKKRTVAGIETVVSPTASSMAAGSTAAALPRASATGRRSLSDLLISLVVGNCRAELKSEQAPGAPARSPSY